MPIRHAAAGVVKHAVLFERTSSGELAVSTFWTYKAGAVSPARITAEQNVISSWLAVGGAGGWKGAATAGWRAVLLKAWDFSVVPPAKGSQVVVNVAGEGGTTLAPSSLSVAMALRSQPVGASVRGINGRIYHVGLPRAFVVGDYLDSGFGNQMRSIYNALRAAFIAGAGAGCGVWSIVSFFDAGSRTTKVARAVPLVLPVDHILCSERVATQRRRLPRQNSFPLGT